MVTAAAVVPVSGVTERIPLIVVMEFVVGLLVISGVFSPFSSVVVWEVDDDDPVACCRRATMVDHPLLATTDGASSVVVVVIVALTSATDGRRSALGLSPAADETAIAGCRRLLLLLLLW